MSKSESAKLSRGQKRHIERLSDAIDKVTDADARFFLRFPARSYRFRLASRVEIEVNDVMLDGQGPEPAGRRWYVVVKQIRPGVRLRAFTLGNPGIDEASEVEARAVWDILVRPGSQAFEIEEAYRAAGIGRAE